MTPNVESHLSEITVGELMRWINCSLASAARQSNTERMKELAWLADGVEAALERYHGAPQSSPFKRRANLGALATVSEDS